MTPALPDHVHNAEGGTATDAVERSVQCAFCEQWFVAIGMSGRADEHNWTACAIHTTERLRDALAKAKVALDWADDLFASIAALKDQGIWNSQMAEAYKGYAEARNAIGTAP